MRGTKAALLANPADSELPADDETVAERDGACAVTLTDSAVHHLAHKYGVFQPIAASYPQHVVDKGSRAVDKWNMCNKGLTLRNTAFAIRHK